MYQSSWWTLGCSKRVEDTVLKLECKNGAFCWFLLCRYITIQSWKNVKFVRINYIFSSVPFDGESSWCVCVCVLTLQYYSYRLSDWQCIRYTLRLANISEVRPHIICPLVLWRHDITRWIVWFAHLHTYKPVCLLVGPVVLLKTHAWCPHKE